MDSLNKYKTLSIFPYFQTELSERLRLRRSGGGRGDTSEDDEGFPHSLCNSPTTTDTIDKTALKVRIVYTISFIAVHKNDLRFHHLTKL